MDSSAGSKVAELSRELKLPYAEQGDAAGIPVVLLHGFLDSLRSFELVLAHLPGFVHAFALTQRGHGDASRPVSGYAIPDFAGDLTAFMDAMGIERGVIVGHSLGSAVARRFATDHPERTLGLVLVGATATVRGTPEARKHWDALLAELTDPVDAGFVRDAFEGDTVQPLPPEFLDALVHEGAKVPAFVWREAFEARWSAEENPHELELIAAPTLICWGDRDPRYPRGDQDALVEAIRDARLIVYRGAGHCPHWEQPDRFASDVAAFARGLG